MSTPLHRLHHAERWALVREVAFSRELRGLPLDVLAYWAAGLAVAGAGVLAVMRAAGAGRLASASAALAAVVLIVVVCRALRGRSRHRRRWFSPAQSPGGGPSVPAAQRAPASGWAAGTRSDPWN